MDELDSEKFHQLLLDWLKHEHWIQNGCPDDSAYELRVPGYRLAAQQGRRVYDLYRHSFPPFFAGAEGFVGIHEDLIRMVEDARKKHPDVMRRLMTAYQEPGEEFKAQWGNLFDVVFYDGLTHQSLLEYQRKYEVELPLRFLANLCEVVSTGMFDLNLKRFRDSRNNLKKGNLAQYVKGGIRRYPALKSIVDQAFNTRLRNVVGHNAYRIRDGVIYALDGSFSLTEQEFIRALDALQVLQNLVLWLFLSTREDRSSLESRGILTIGWGIDQDQNEPHLTILQLAPFHALDKQAQWLNDVVLKQGGDHLVTQLSDAPAIHGPITDELKPILKLIRESRRLVWSLIPVMPCIHTHDAYSLPEGSFCQVANDVAGLAKVHFPS